MKLTGFAFSFFVTCFAFAADILPGEDQLQGLMINQNDPVFVEKGLSRSGNGSSLCGPASAINWLQIEGANLSKEQQQDLLSSVADTVLKNGIDVTQGLIEPQLVEFLEALNISQNKTASYSGKGRYFKDHSLTLEDLLSDQPQIILLKYESRPQAQAASQRGRNPRGRADFSPREQTDVIRGFHFVLKVAADASSQEITFIDSENPSRYSRAKIEVRENPETKKADLRLLPSSSEDLRHFQSGPRLLWSVLSLIEKN